jgi:uncharacterized membrane protein
LYNELSKLKKIYIIYLETFDDKSKLKKKNTYVLSDKCYDLMVSIQNLDEVDGKTYLAIVIFTCDNELSTRCYTTLSLLQILIIV